MLSTISLSFYYLSKVNFYAPLLTNHDQYSSTTELEILPKYESLWNGMFPPIGHERNLYLRYIPASSGRTWEEFSHRNKKGWVLGLLNAGYPWPFSFLTDDAFSKDH